MNERLKAKLLELEEAFEEYKDGEGCGCCSKADHSDAKMNGLIEEIRLLAEGLT